MKQVKMTRESFHVFQAAARNALKQSEEIPSVLIPQNAIISMAPPITVIVTGSSVPNGRIGNKIKIQFQKLPTAAARQSRTTEHFRCMHAAVRNRDKRLK